MNLNHDRLLIIPDVHQDIDWAVKILEKEDGNYDGTCFLGDYFDSWYEKKLPGTKAVCEFLTLTQEQYKATFLIGNHDAQYFSTYDRASKVHGLRQEEMWSHPMNCSGYSRTRSNDITKYLPREFIYNCHIAVKAHGYLLSHAGVMPYYWPTVYDEGVDSYGEWVHNRELEEEKFFKICRQAVDNIQVDPRHPLWNVGVSRGGTASVGGPLWCDFREEFQDELHLPQIMGHTGGPKENPKGRSYCLDYNQSKYGILTAKGLEVKDV